MQDQLNFISELLDMQVQALKNNHHSGYNPITGQHTIETIEKIADQLKKIIVK